MRILFLTSGRRVPSSRFRVLQYVPHLRRLGHACVVAPSHPPKYEHYGWLGWRPSQRVQRMLRHWDRLRLAWGRFDVVYLERELFHDETFDVEQSFRAACRTLVLDVDDAIFLHAPRKFEALARMADVVIAGNRLLAERIRPLNEQVTVIPTCLDVERFRPLAARESAEGDGSERPVVIGWTGTSANLGFLAMLRKPLQELARRHTIELRIIADERADIATLGLEPVPVRFVPWRERTEIADLAGFDIGVMPLPDTDWTRYKCGLKILQYMALEIPAVASPVGVNSQIVRDGENGFLPDADEGWLDVLDRLVTSRALRNEIGGAGRRTIEQGYSIQRHVPKLIETLAEAVARTGEGRKEAQKTQRV